MVISDGTTNAVLFDMTYPVTDSGCGESRFHTLLGEESDYHGVGKGRGEPLLDVAARCIAGGTGASRDDQSAVISWDGDIAGLSGAVMDAPGLSNAWGKLLMIADGVPGLEGSEVTRRAFVDGTLHYIVSAMPWMQVGDDGEARGDWKGRTLLNLGRALVRCERRLRRIAGMRGLDNPAGGSITLAYIRWPDLFVVHTGDSGCFLLRRGQVHCIASKHTRVDRQALAAGNDETCPPRSIVDDATERAISNVDMHHVTLAKGDCVLLGSHELSRCLHECDIAGCLGARSPAEAMCEDLLQATREVGCVEPANVMICRCE